MRSVQFWILLLVSLAVCALYLKQIQLSRTTFFQERALADSQEAVSRSSTYENGWKQLAIRLYETSRQDPQLQQVLKDAGIGIHSSPPGTTPPAAPPANGPASSKTPAPATAHTP
jgi:hypothetical protein